MFILLNSLSSKTCLLSDWLRTDCLQSDKDPQGALLLLQPRWGVLIDLLEESAASIYPEPPNTTHSVVMYKQLVKGLIFYSVAGSALGARCGNALQWEPMINDFL